MLYAYVLNIWAKCIVYNYKYQEIAKKIFFLKMGTNLWSPGLLILTHFEGLLLKYCLKTTLQYEFENWRLPSLAGTSRLSECHFDASQNVMMSSCLLYMSKVCGLEFPSI